MSLLIRDATIDETQDNPIARKVEFDNDQNLGSW